MRLGEMLVREGLVTEGQVQRALEDQKAYGGRLGRHLVDLGFVSEDALLDALGRQLRLPRIDLEQPGMIAPDAARYVRADLAEQWGFCPVVYDARSGVLTIATSDPDPQSLSTIEQFTGHKLEIRLASPEQIDRAIGRLFHGEGTEVVAKPLQGLQIARSARPSPQPEQRVERPQASDHRMSESLGPPPGTSRQAPGAPPPAANVAVDLGAQIAQQLSVQQQFQQMQQQLQMHQMQQQLAPGMAMPMLPAAYPAGPVMPGHVPGAMPGLPPPHPSPHAGQTMAPPLPNQPGYGYAGYYAPPAQPAPPSPPPAPAPSHTMIARAGPAVDTGPTPPVTLEQLAENLARLEKTLAAQARALRSLVEVLIDRGLLTKAEMARKQQGSR